MGKGNFPLYAFNRGEVSRLALGRVDLDRMRLSAEEQVNWQPMVLGPMTLRPGLQYLGGIRDDDLKPVFIPFVFGNDDTAALELTGGFMRVWVNDTPVIREGVGTTITNGDFSSAEGWTLDAEPGCSAAIAGEKLKLSAQARGGSASYRRKIGVNKKYRGAEHAFRIVVEKGPVTFRAGNLEGGDTYIATTQLAEGTHSLAFTPAGDSGLVHIEFEASDAAERIVDSIAIEARGVLELPTLWAAGDLPYVRHAQSGDVIFVACQGVPPYRIERRGTHSWSVVKFLPKNGPLKSVPTPDVKLTPGAMYGNTTLKSDKPFFKATHVGCLFRLFTPGQAREAVLAAEDTYTDAVRITGVGEESRDFSYIVSGTSWIKDGAKLTLQRSFEEGDLGIGFTDTSNEMKKNGVRNVSDKRDNSIIFYRVGFNPGEYKGGVATVKFMDKNGRRNLTSGGGAGFCRVTGVSNSKLASIEILKPFSSVAKTGDWQEGEWSAKSGYPSAAAFHDGRLWWAAGDKIWGSVSDDYSNFDIDKEGDAGPISRSVGYGPIDTINWMLPLSRLILGREGAETSVRSSSLDEPLTPTSFTVKDCSTKGSARIGAVKSDTRGIFVSKSGGKAYELAIDVQAADYVAHDLTRLHPAVAGEGGFTRLCIQQNPETVIHFVRTDGQAAVLVYDKEDEVEAWWRVATDGVIEDAFVLPGVNEDSVYYVVRRMIDGDPRRYLEKFALRSQCAGRPEARLSDSHVIDTGGDSTITGLGHLEGETVVAWGWNNNASSGVDLGTYTVLHGKIGLAAAYNNVCVGLPYAASFTSAKLAYAADQGSAINQKKRVEHVGLILYDTHYQGLQYGQRADVLDGLPLISEGAEVAANTVHAEFDQPMIEVPGEWDTDSRLTLKAASPRPCTVAAAVIGLQTHG